MSAVMESSGPCLHCCHVNWGKKMVLCGYRDMKNPLKVSLEFCYNECTKREKEIIDDAPYDWRDSYY